MSGMAPKRRLSRALAEEVVPALATDEFPAAGNRVRYADRPCQGLSLAE